MPTRGLLSEGERARFLMLPDMDGRELVRHHTLSGADLTAVSVRRGVANRLGFAVQLCLLRYPGRPLRAGEAVPRPIVEFAASQIGADPDAFADYAGGADGGAGRDTTRRKHVAEIVKSFGFRAFDAAAYRELSRWLLPLAEGTDSGVALVGALLEEMRRREIVAPTLSTREAHVGDQAQGARVGLPQARRRPRRGTVGEARFAARRTRGRGRDAPEPIEAPAGSALTEELQGRAGPPGVRVLARAPRGRLRRVRIGRCFAVFWYNTGIIVSYIGILP